MKIASLPMTLFVLLFFACINKTSDEQGHEPETIDLEPLAYTVYSNKSELFVEFKPLVVGSISRFAAHVTVLGELFLPLTEGKITVSLIVGDFGIRYKAEAPSSPGIFRLALNPTKAGIGQLVFDIESKNYSDQIILKNVPVYSDEREARAKQSETTNAGDITYLKEQAWKSEFANAPARVQPFSEVLRTSGQILATPGDEVVLTTQISGIVSYSGKKLVPGSSVSMGTLVFSVNNNEVVQSNLVAAVQQAEQDLATAKLQYERAAELVKNKIISEKNYLELKLRFDNAQTQYTNVTVSRNFNQTKQQISAPLSGFLKNILIENGQFVQAGQALATISNIKRLLLQADISQKYFSRLPLFTSANFKTMESDKIFNTQKLNGRLLAFGKTSGGSSPFVPLFFEIDNSGNFIPGSVVEVFLHSGSKPSLAIPISALLEEQGIFYCYIQTEGESFQKRELKIGASDGVNVHVLSGLTEGERVVTKGAYQIKLSTASGTLPAHGHEH